MKITVRQPNREFVVARQTKDVGKITIQDQTPSFVQVNTEGNPSKVIASKPGIKGDDGSKIYKGSGFPSNSIGIPGDYFIDENSNRMYGPKTISNIWDNNFVTIGGSTIVAEEFTVDSNIQNDKYIDLEFTPTSPEDVEFSVFGGVEQRPNVDFYVLGNRLDWDGLSLEYLLDIGTTFTVRYTI